MRLFRLKHIFERFWNSYMYLKFGVYLDLVTKFSLIIVLFQYEISFTNGLVRSGKFQNKFVCDFQVNREDVFARTKVMSVLQCTQACFDSYHLCIAFDVTVMRSGMLTCRLRDKPLPGNCLTFGPGGNGTIYYEKGDGMRQLESTIPDLQTTTAYPCQNGGTYSDESCSCDLGCYGTFCQYCYKDCMEGSQNGLSGIVPAWIHPTGFPTAFRTLCNFDFGITYVQYRRNGNVNFNRSWSEYENGFGDLNGDFWLGNKYIYAILQQGSYRLGIRYYYVTFWMISEYSYIRIYNANESYKIEHGFSTFGLDILSQLTNDKRMDGQTFKTYDRDSTGCASAEGSGWWFNNLCSNCNINGRFPLTIGIHSGITMTGMGLF